MTSPTHRPVAGSDALTNLLLGLIAGAFGFGLLLWVAGHLASWVTGATPPTASIPESLAVLAQPGDPATALGATGLHPVAYWTALAVLLAASGALAWGVWRLFRRPAGVRDPHSIDGVATGIEVSRAASGRALVRRGRTLRPSLEHPSPAEVGYRLGTARGRAVWATVEDSMLLVGPPRAGKGHHIIIPFILDAPGAVLTTSTRPDNLAATLRARQRLGPVAVFDPQSLAPGVPAGLRWSPVRGCADPLTAMIRARGLASATGFGSVENGSFWQGKTEVAIQCLLHAAALDGRDTRTLYQWSLAPTAATDAVNILRSASRAAEGWADALDAMIQADPRTRDSIWHGVSLAFASLADPRVLAALSPTPGEQFDPTEFLQNRGTLYLLATGAGSGAAAALVAALVEDLVETARHLAAASRGARLDPPLLLALDEIANLSPLPSLPTLMSEGGGSGITTLPVLQSLAQARAKWGEHAATVIWDAAIVKIILGGGSHTRDLADISTLMGERDELTASTSTDRGGGKSWQQSVRRMAVVPADVLRTLAFGTAIVLLRTARPIITTLTPWTARGDASQLRKDRAAVEAELIRHAAAPEAIRAEGHRAPDREPATKEISDADQP